MLVTQSQQALKACSQASSPVRFSAVRAHQHTEARRRLHKRTPHCSAAGSQFLPQCPPGHATLASQSLPEEASPGARSKQIIQAAISLAVAGLAVAVIWVIGGLSGLSLKLKQNIAATSAASGLAAGFLHTICGPDHLAALTPLTIGRNRFKASLLGSLWGVGHSAGQLVLGLGFVLLKAQFTSALPFLERWCSTVVGLTVLAIGSVGIYESVLKRSDEAESEEDDTLKQITEDKTAGQAKVAAATFGTGVLHGLQPDSMFVIIPALALPSSLASFAYCSMFVVGTVVAMGGYTLFLGAASEELCKDRPWLQQNLSLVASCFAIVVGVMVILSAFGVAVPL